MGAAVAEFRMTGGRPPPLLYRSRGSAVTCALPVRRESGISPPNKATTSPYLDQLFSFSLLVAATPTEGQRRALDLAADWLARRPGRRGPSPRIKARRRPGIGHQFF